MTLMQTNVNLTPKCGHLYFSGVCLSVDLGTTSKAYVLKIDGSTCSKYVKAQQLTEFCLCGVWVWGGGVRGGPVRIVTLIMNKAFIEPPNL